LAQQKTIDSAKELPKAEKWIEQRDADRRQQKS
jgi:hypothetical protein